MEWSHRDSPIAKKNNSKAFTYSLRLLAARDRAELEIREKLAKKGFLKEETEEAIAKLRKLGLLDEKKFIKEYVRAKRARHWGPFKVKLGLVALGIQKSDADAEIRQTDWREPLKKLVSSNKGLEKRKLYSKLSRLGFPSDLIKSEMKCEEQDD